MLFAASQVFTNLGFLLEYCLGPYVRFDTLVLISAAPSLLYLLCIPFVQESPYYLLSRGYYEEAKTVLVRLRGRQDVAAEFKAIQEVVGECEKSTWRNLFKGSNRRALGLACGAMLVKQLTGGWAVTSFAGPLMASGGLPSGQASAVLGLAKLVTSAITILLVFKFGIKRLVLISLLGIAAAHLCLLVYFFLHKYDTHVTDGFHWIPLVALIQYFVFSDFGIGPFPGFIGAELFSQKCKGAGTALAHTTGHISAVVAMFLFTSVDFVITLCFFTVASLVSIPFIAGCLVDTKGKTLAEIQKRLPKRQVELHM